MDSTQNQVDQFVKLLKKKFSPVKVILFGSRARGDDWIPSDYDFIIISDKFKGVKWLDRIDTIARLWPLDIDIDVLPYTTDEFDEKQKISSVVKQAVKEGKVLAEV